MLEGEGRVGEKRTISVYFKLQFSVLPPKIGGGRSTTAPRSCGATMENKTSLPDIIRTLENPQCLKKIIDRNEAVLADNGASTVALCC